MYQQSALYKSHSLIFINYLRLYIVRCRNCWECKSIDRLFGHAVVNTSIIIGRQILVTFLHGNNCILLANFSVFHHNLKPNRQLVSQQSQGLLFFNQPISHHLHGEENAPKRLDSLLFLDSWQPLLWIQGSTWSRGPVADNELSSDCIIVHWLSDVPACSSTLMHKL